MPQRTLISGEKANIYRYAGEKRRKANCAGRCPPHASPPPTPPSQMAQEKREHGPGHPTFSATLAAPIASNICLETPFTPRKEHPSLKSSRAKSHSRKHIDANQCRLPMFRTGIPGAAVRRIQVQSVRPARVPAFRRPQSRRFQPDPRPRSMIPTWRMAPTILSRGRSSNQDTSP